LTHANYNLDDHLIESAAKTLWSTWQVNQHIDALPIACRPSTRIDGYRIQAHIARLSAQKVFGWKIRKRADGQIAFDDTVGEVSGTWVQSSKHRIEPGILVYIMVTDIQKTIRDIESSGGKIVQPVGGDAPEITARFSDPFGNVFGIYQERTLN